ncbi:MAG TPA: hypothetical protein PK082_11760 [Phycisphaerae bacterium]|nr:hypothetical protein [Phycisphaerae bacterium]
MRRHGWIVLTMVAAGALVGCGPRTPGESRMMGTVEYPAAFASARDVFAQYFSVASADLDAGIIRSLPRKIDAPNDRLLGGSPARQVATLRLRRDGGNVVAQVCVETQRQGSAVYRQMASRDENYDSVPHESPAQIDAATTPEQNETWRTASRDRALEIKILNDVYRALHPGEK